jgi:hypothetical protein
MNHFAAITVIALLASSAVHATQMYRWVDENGVTQFSYKRPPQKNAEQLELKGGNPGTTSANADKAPSGVATVIKRELYNKGWEGCITEICETVRQLDPACTSSFCSQAKRFSKNCTSVSCRAKKLGFKREMEERLAFKRKQQQGSRTFSTAAPGGESDQEQLKRLMAKCERQPGADCDIEHEQRRLPSRESSLTRPEK